MYISATGAESVRSYKYKGGDRSKLYKYVLSPFAEWCVANLTPEWLAPNLITLIGLSAVLGAHLLTVYFAPGMTEGEIRDTPRWVWLVCGLCLFFYSTMDNMDGKQARKIGASSALGLLFDHGCDALNAGLLAGTPAAAALYSGVDGGLVLGLWFVITVPFYFATWEEFHVGALYLPLINGPSEGIILTVLMFLSVAVFGPESWAEEIEFLGLERRIALVRITVFAVFATCALQFFNVCRDEAAKGRSVVRAVARLSPLITLQSITVAWQRLSPQLFREHPRLFMLLPGFVFADCVAKLMVAHICHQRYRPNWLVIGTMALGPLNSALPQFGLSDDVIVDEIQLLRVLTVIGTVSFWYFVIQAIAELKASLGIPLLRVAPEILEANATNQAAPTTPAKKQRSRGRSASPKPGSKQLKTQKLRASTPTSTSAKKPAASGKRRSRTPARASASTPKRRSRSKTPAAKTPRHRATSPAVTRSSRKRR